MRFAIGVDIGQENDNAVISIGERVPQWSNSVLAPHPLVDTEKTIIDLYRLVGEVVLELGTPYSGIVDAVSAIYYTPQMQNEAKVILDYTGVGRPVREMFQAKGIHPICVNITGGVDVVKHEDVYNVPKRDLVQTAMVMFNTERLKFTQIEDLDGLIKQFQNFKPKELKSKGIGYEAATSQYHDDRVMALALWLWWMNRTSTSMPWARKHKTYDWDNEAQLRGEPDST